MVLPRVRSNFIPDERERDIVITLGYNRTAFIVKHLSKLVTLRNSWNGGFWCCLQCSSSTTSMLGILHHLLVLHRKFGIQETRFRGDEIYEQLTRIAVRLEGKEYEIDGMGQRACEQSPS